MTSSSGFVLNFNVGVLGHVDSGKTTLAKALSTTASTASFDKNPQSQERGITLDLGFSSFAVDLPDHLKIELEASKGLKFDEFGSNPTLQFTLVDCPGHASLIRTIIGGSQIIDMMLLVVDAIKGMQTQTAECLVLGEITAQRMVVAINKIDQLPEEKRELLVAKMCKKMQKTLETTKFSGCPIIPISAKWGGAECDSTETVGLKELVVALAHSAYVPQRDFKGPFIFAVDHCFSIRGQGTVLTGTVISGMISVGNNIEVPVLKVVRKVKSIQMFRKPIDRAVQGDRVGICITQFDPKEVERGLLCSPGTLPILHAAIASVVPIRYYKGAIFTKAKFHVSLGHETVMAICHFFGVKRASVDEKFDWDCEYSQQEELISSEAGKLVSGAKAMPDRQFVLLRFERPVAAPTNCLVIGSKLDTDIHQNTCRMAFHGKLLEGIEDKSYPETVLPRLRIFKMKQKEGIVERMLDQFTVVSRALFRKETNIQNFSGLKVTLSTGEEGTIEGSFGQSGKVKLRISAGLRAETIGILGKTTKKSKENRDTEELHRPLGSNTIRVYLKFKRYVHDPNKRLIQA